MADPESGGRPFDGSCGCSSEDHVEASEEYLAALDDHSPESEKRCPSCGRTGWYIKTRFYHDRTASTSCSFRPAAGKSPGDIGVSPGRDRA